MGPLRLLEEFDIVPRQFVMVGNSLRSDIAPVVALGGDSVLLCRRAIEPRRGFWTIPAGYMELGETAAEGAAREAWEDAGSPEVAPSFLWGQFRGRSWG